MQNSINNEKLLKAALLYLDRFHVLPIKSTDKHPTYSWKEYQSVKPDADWLRYKFDAIKASGLVAVTGKTPGILVVDIDPNAELSEADFPTTLTAITGRNGRHLYFKYPEGVSIKSVSGWRKNVDIRADGGLIKLPPSQHANGNYYKWVDKNTPIAEPPQWLIDELTKTGSTAERMDTSVFSRKTTAGERNSTLVSITGKLLHHLPEKDWIPVAFPILEAINDRNFDPPLSKKELENCYYSIARSEQEQRKNGGNGSNAEQRPSLDVVLEILASQTEIMLNQFGEACYKIKDMPYVEKIPSLSLERMLRHDFYHTEGKGVGLSTVRQAVDIYREELERKSRTKTEVNIRIGRHSDNLIYDLSDGRHFIIIDANGWSLTEVSPILFETQKSQLPQVKPSNEQIDLKELFHFINVTNPHDQLLVLVYIVCAFIPDIPRPVLSANGEQGAAKTTALKIIRSLVDPANPAIVSPPKDVNEMIQLASHNYVLLLDNLTYLQDWQSNAICRFVTADGFSKRSLYTNDEDFLYSFMRVVGLSGINQLATKPDLLDRSLIIKFERPTPDKRLTERELWSNFNFLKPRFFGTLLSVVSKTLEAVADITVDKPIRLVDFHQYATAAAIVMGYSPEFLNEALLSNNNRQNNEALEASGVAKSIMKFMDGKDEFSDSSNNLYSQLKEIAVQELSSTSFPKGSNWLWKKIVEVRPNLQEVGIICEHEDTQSAHSVIRIKNNGSHIPNKPEFTVDNPRAVLDEIDSFETDAGGGMEAFEAKKEVL